MECLYHLLTEINQHLLLYITHCGREAGFPQEHYNLPLKNTQTKLNKNAAVANIAASSLICVTSRLLPSGSRCSVLLGKCAAAYTGLTATALLPNQTIQITHLSMSVVMLLLLWSMVKVAVQGQRSHMHTYAKGRKMPNVVNIVLNQLFTCLSDSCNTSLSSKATVLFDLMSDSDICRKAKVSVSSSQLSLGIHFSTWTWVTSLVWVLLIQVVPAVILLKWSLLHRLPAVSQHSLSAGCIFMYV